MHTFEILLQHTDILLQHTDILLQHSETWQIPPKTLPPRNPPNRKTRDPRYKFRWNQNLNWNLYREIPRTLNFSIWWILGCSIFSGNCHRGTPPEMRTAQHICNRALCICKRALYICKRALYIRNRVFCASHLFCACVGLFGRYTGPLCRYIGLFWKCPQVATFWI